MQGAINFPHLGIHLKDVGESISIFGFQIAYYGILIALALFVGIMIATIEGKRTGQKSEDYLDLGIVVAFCAILGARVYYVIFSWEEYKDNFWSIFNIREGGLAVYGGIIACVIAVFIFAKVKNLSAAIILDTAVLGLMAGQVIGRFGNFFNREAFGEYTDGLFAMQLPKAMVRAKDVTELMEQNIVVIEGVNFIQVHPTFLYEALWNLVLLIVLLIYRKQKKFNGEIFLLYLVGYGIGRFWIEGLRTDQLLIPGVGWAVSRVLALVLLIGAATVLAVNYYMHSVKMKKRANQRSKRKDE